MAMATSATAVCQLLLNQLRSSNLNFIVSETPYSAQIMLRKRFVKEASGPAWAKAPMDQYETPNNIVDDQSELIKNLEHNNQSLSETNSLLENKLAMAEASAYKTFNEKADEIAILKKNIKTRESEINALRTDFNQEKKTMKEKEKECFRLDQKCDNLLDNIKKLKNDMADLKGENKKLLKENRRNDKSKKNLTASTEPLCDFSPSSSIIPIQTISSTPQPISYFKSSFLDNNSNSSPSLCNIKTLTMKPDSPQPEIISKLTLSCLKPSNSKSPSTPSSLSLSSNAALLAPTSEREKTTPSSSSPRTPPGTPPALSALSATARKLPPAYQQMIAGVDEILKLKFPG